MISDVLFEALEELREYTENPFWQETYGNDIILEVEKIMESMEAMRVKLDTPPDPLIKPLKTVAARVRKANIPEWEQ